MKIQKSMILLQYPAANTKVCGATVTEDEAGKFVALDASSGGYPYATEIERAHDFKTLAAARAYNKVDNDKFKVCEVTVTYAITVKP